MSQPLSETTATTEELHKVSLIDHLDVYSRILYDVEGNILVNNENIVMNVYKPEMKEALENKCIRVMRNSTMSDICYRYFVINDQQTQTFNRERQWGSKSPNKSYHVYVDVDCRDHPLYRTMFKKTREQNDK